MRSRKALAADTRPEALVFASRKGTPLSPEDILKRVIQPACDRLKMPRVGWHTFRNTHATLLNELGESVKTAQAILGHSDIATTLQIGHDLPESLQLTGEKGGQSMVDIDALTEFRHGVALLNNGYPQPALVRLRRAFECERQNPFYLSFLWIVDRACRGQLGSSLGAVRNSRTAKSEEGAVLFELSRGFHLLDDAQRRWRRWTPHWNCLVRIRD